MPIITCICGSTRFKDEIRTQEMLETIKGNIVVSLGCYFLADHDVWKTPDASNIKRRLCLLHLDKIDLANEVLIVNVGGYIGEHTKRELAYAYHVGKLIRFVEPIEPAGSWTVLRELVDSVVIPVRETYYESGSTKS